MDKIADLPSRKIMEVVMPTFGAYFPLQAARREEIFKDGPTEHQYGPHDRQKLDVYLPPNASESSAKLPCVMFIYGGGLTQGDKRIAPVQGAVYGNVGHYFSHQGFVAVLPDYRLYGTHDAIFPSGGEDVGLALDWVVKNVSQVDASKIFIIGNSAGAVHTSTLLYSDEIPASVPRHPIRGALLTQVPFHFNKAEADRQKMLDGYYDGKVDERTPIALRQKSKDKTETAILIAELEPEDEILEPTRDFLAIFPLGDGIPTPELLPTVQGHNHISTFLSLGLGGKEDAWGKVLVDWMKARC